MGNYFKRIRNNFIIWFFSGHGFRYLGAFIVYNVLRNYFGLNFSFSESMLIGIGLALMTR
jgi:hypothetical protein